MKAFAHFQAERRISREAVAPWERDVQAELLVGTLVPRESAKRLRAVAREMSVNATWLREKARELEEQAQKDMEAPGGWSLDDIRPVRDEQS